MLAGLGHRVQSVSHTEDEGIHRRLVVGPLVSQSSLELDIDRLKVDARDRYLAIFVERRGRRG